MAFITDSGGPNGIIVVYLATGRSWRRLAGHPSVLADPGFVPIIDGQPFMLRPAGGEPTFYETGSDGIALSADGTHLYYCPLSSRRLDRLPLFHEGQDLRRKPYLLVRRPIDAGPVRLG